MMDFLNTKEVGDYGEAQAVHYLRRRGYTVRERNYRAGKYEIDIIASRFGVIAFVEVKTRIYREEDISCSPPPGHAVNAEKQRFTRQAAKQYLFEHPTKRQPRMDVIEISLVRVPNRKKPRLITLNHIKAAY